MPPSTSSSSNTSEHAFETNEHIQQQGIAPLVNSSTESAKTTASMARSSDVQHAHLDHKDQETISQRLGDAVENIEHGLEKGVSKVTHFIKNSVNLMSEEI